MKYSEIQGVKYSLSKKETSKKGPRWGLQTRVAWAKAMTIYYVVIS
jgi:hypothetical protein